MQRGRFNLWLSYAVLACGLVITVLAAWYVRFNLRFTTARQLQTSSYILEQSMRQRFERDVDVLLATRGFFNASDNVTRDTWRTYTQEIDLRNHYPELLAIGFGLHVQAANIADHEAMMRRGNLPDYHVTPQTGNAAVSPIIFMEPGNKANQCLLGYDITADPALAPALHQAATSGGPVLSSLLHNSPLLPTHDATMLVIVPVYRGGATLSTPEARAAALLGYVFSPCDLQRMFTGILKDRGDLPGIDFSVIDQTDVPSVALFKPAAATPTLAKTHAETAIDLVGRHWLVDVWPSAAAQASGQSQLPTLVLFCGILISWLIFGVIWVQIRARVILEKNENELRQAMDAAEGANRAKDEFLAVLSHELRNPLAPVLSMVNALQEKILSGSETQMAFTTIRRNVELEARLIDDLLDITRISRGKMRLDPEVFDLHSVIYQAIEITERDLQGKSIRLELDFTATESHVFADPARLQQVLWNLLKNAVKFTPERGAIKIVTRNAAAPAATGRPALIIEVSDTGIGISPDKIARIFDAFEQADRSITQRFGGLGLGLAISKALVDAHDGTLVVTSPGVNQGATFRVTLPTVERPQITAPQTVIDSSVTSAPAPAPPAANPRIILVEDQPDARRGMLLLLQKSGYDVAAAGTMNEALTLARRAPFDLLLSDLGLPDGSGFELVEHLRAELPFRFHAVALSGLGMEEDIARARAAGFDDHLTKPVDFLRLEAVLQHYLGTPGALPM